MCKTFNTKREEEDHDIEDTTTYDRWLTHCVYWDDINTFQAIMWWFPFFWTVPGTNITGKFSTKSHIFPPNAQNEFLLFPSY